MATHRAAECKGKDWKPSQAKSSTKEGKDALSQASNSGPRKDPRGRAADHQKTGKSSKKRRCYNCGDEGHVLPQCQLPRANPLPFQNKPVKETQLVESSSSKVFSKPPLAFSAVAAFPKMYQQVAKQVPTPRDIPKVFLPIVDAKAKYLNMVLGLLDGGATHSWILDSIGARYPVVAVADRAFSTASTPIKA